MTLGYWPALAVAFWSACATPAPAIIPHPEQTQLAPNAAPTEQRREAGEPDFEGIATTLVERSTPPGAAPQTDLKDAAPSGAPPSPETCFPKLLSTVPAGPCEDVADYALRPIRRVGTRVRLLGRLTIHDSGFTFLDPLDSHRDGEVNVHTWWGGDQPVCHRATIVEVDGEIDDPRFGVTGLETISLPLRRVRIVRSFADNANVVCL